MQKKERPFSLRICSSQEMREIDAETETHFGIDAQLLMENASRAAVQALLECFPEAGRTTEILIFAGKGNNAGDAFGVARRLLCLEKKVRVFHLHPESGYKGAVQKNFEILKKLKAKLSFLDHAQDLQAFFQSASGPFTVIDGLIGTGLKGPLEGLFYDVVEVIHQARCQEIIALDIPSGVCGDTGAIYSNALQADLTLSFGFPKLGHFLPPGATKRGRLLHLDISLPPAFKKKGHQFLLLKNSFSDFLSQRNRYGHKNSFGHSLFIGGSPGRLGAICMAAEACQKMGTGLVTVATWKDCFETAMVKLPHEIMSVPLVFEGEEAQVYRNALPSYSGIVIGPGLGFRPGGALLLTEILKDYPGPIVLDADAIHLIAEHKLHAALVARAPAPTVLTPHPGEMAKLLGLPKEEVLTRPIEALRQAIHLTHATVVLKGATTLMGSAEEVIYLNHYPNDGMATAGSGDVLSGMIGGLLGQQLSAFQSTLLGVYLHSLAGDFAAQHYGHRSMTATHIIEHISHAFQDLQSTQQAPPLDDCFELR